MEVTALVSHEMTQTRATDELILRVIRAAQKPLKAKHISKTLRSTYAVEMSRKEVNGRLYGQLRSLLVLDKESRTWAIASVSDEHVNREQTLVVDLPDLQVPKGPKWSRNEARVLVAIFDANDFSIGDDARPECRLIASELGRPPSSVDRQWRNVAKLLSGGQPEKIGRTVVDAVYWFQSDPNRARQMAPHICETEGWVLQTLLSVTDE